MMEDQKQEVKRVAGDGGKKEEQGDTNKMDFVKKGKMNIGQTVNKKVTQCKHR